MAGDPTPAGDPPPVPGRPAEPPTCDYCGSTALTWRRCKLMCENCKQIVMSCEDL